MNGRVDRRARKLLDEAGRLYLLHRELAAAEQERDGLDQRIRQLKRKVDEADAAFESTYRRVLTRGRGDVSDGAGGEADVVTPGKLPDRVVTHMRRDRSRIYTAAEIAADLHIADVQQVRTALARLVAKSLVRRTDRKGEFTL